MTDHEQEIYMKGYARALDTDFELLFLKGFQSASILRDFKEKRLINEIERLTLNKPEVKDDD